MKQKSTACRLCGEPLERLILDLGMSPLCQNRIMPDQLNEMEPFFPLRVYLCEHCFLVQLDEYVAPDQIFSDYAYFSSYSTSWLEHARHYVEMITDRLGLDADSRVVELASNDGYLLRNFVERGIPCLGVEPAENVAAAARDNGIPTVSRFFGERVATELAADGGRADLIIGNNVLAHVPALNDFVAGIRTLLADDGVVTMEFPHLERLIDENQFDTIYHEHFSYFSFFVVQRVFARHGMRIFDVEELPTHGGSLRIYACHADKGIAESPAVGVLRARELERGFDRFEIYEAFAEHVRETKRKLLQFLISEHEQHHKVVAYGAPGKGNTLLNYCGIGTDLIEFTVDASPHKQGTYTPGTHIPVLHPDAIREARPDMVLILPWNLRSEIAEQLSFISDWGGHCAVPIPEVAVIQ